MSKVTWCNEIDIQCKILMRQLLHYLYSFLALFYTLENKRHRKPKGYSSMDNPEKWQHWAHKTKTYISYINIHPEINVDLKI